ncbi:hypothetical protein FACS1894110_02180 [Spirochaetia bacterium]|nr:hypothetical protein FACS1894110_02180 [Spirochaetia bacterium]
MLNTNNLLTEYDRGDGVCRYLKNNLCEIYEDRPVICNVEKMYDAFFREYMTEQDFIDKNLVSCKQLIKLYMDGPFLEMCAICKKKFFFLIIFHTWKKQLSRKMWKKKDFWGERK